MRDNAGILLDVRGRAGPLSSGHQPLPLGAQALAEWWAYWRIENEEPAPVVGQDDAWLGLAARRLVLPAGHVWLLGLVESIVPSPYRPNLWWCWADPVILIETHTHTPADLDTLTKAVRPLLAWYNRTLLGETFRTGGPVPLFTTPDECRTAVVNTYRALLRSNSRPTRSLVAQRLGFSESGLRKSLTRLGLKWKDLVAEARAK